MEWLGNQTPEGILNRQQADEREFAKVKNKRLVNKKILKFRQGKEASDRCNITSNLTARDGLAMLKHLLEPISWSKNASVNISY